MMEDKIKCLYYIKDIRTDKIIYIGQTINFKNRKYIHFGHKTQPVDEYMYNEGRDNFLMEIFNIDCLNMTDEEILKKEDELILKYDSINNGFNINRGGRNHIWTEEQRKIMSERNMGEKNPNYGKPRSEETKKKIGEANKISQLGHHHTEETKQKMSQAHKKNIPILCVETGIIYDCPIDAARSIGKNAGGHITEVCQGKRNTAYGYHWKYTNKGD